MANTMHSKRWLAMAAMATLGTAVWAAEPGTMMMKDDGGHAMQGERTMTPDDMIMKGDEMIEQGQALKKKGMKMKKEMGMGKDGMSGGKMDTMDGSKEMMK
jgi:hypothetical protein